MSTALIALGSNLGDRLAYLGRAIEAFARHEAIHTLCTSSFYETSAVAMSAADPAGPFLNAALSIETTLPPAALLAFCQELEASSGRVQARPMDGYLSRYLDVDILFYDALVQQDDALQIPHPRLHERLFVLYPLAEIAGDWVHPTLNLTIRALKARLLTAPPDVEPRPVWHAAATYPSPMSFSRAPRRMPHP